MNPQLIAALKQRRSEIIAQLDQELMTELADIDRLLRRNEGLPERTVKGPLAPPNAPPHDLIDYSGQDAPTGQETGKPPAWMMVLTPELAAMKNLDGSPVWIQADVDRVNNERRMALEADAAQKKQIPLSHLTIDASQQRIERVPVGQRNAAGDECIRLDHRGFSVFLCPRGHGYCGDNPNIAGCPTCFREGTSGSESSDGEREEPF